MGERPQRSRRCRRHGGTDGMGIFSAGSKGTRRVNGATHGFHQNQGEGSVMKFKRGKMLAWGLAALMASGVAATAGAQEQEGAAEGAGPQAPRRMFRHHRHHRGYHPHGGAHWLAPGWAEGAVFLDREHAEAFVAQLARVSGMSQEEITQLLQQVQERQREAFKARVQERNAQREARMQERVSQRLEVLKERGRLTQEQYDELSRAVAEKDWTTLRKRMREWMDRDRPGLRRGWGPRGHWGKPGPWGPHGQPAEQEP